MIKIKKDGRYFDLADGEKVTTEWVSTLFNDDTDFNGSYTWSVKAPFTDNNNALLGNAYMLENRSARGFTTGLLEVFGQTWKQCKLMFDVTADGYELACLIDSGEFAKQLKEKTLPQVFINFKDGKEDTFIFDELAGSVQGAIDELVYRAAHPGERSCVFFPQKNDSLFGSVSEGQHYDSSYMLNYFNAEPAFKDYVNTLANDTIAFYNPSYYLHWVIRQVCTWLGFEATGDFFTDSGTRTLVIDNTGFYSMQSIFSDLGCRIAPARHLPKIKIADFLKMIRATFKVVIYFDSGERKAHFEYAPAIVNGRDAVDISGFTEPRPVIKSYVPTGYTLIQPVDDKDDLFKTFEYTESFFIGDQDEPKKLDSFTGTCFMTGTNEPRPGYGTTWRIPRKSQVGNGYASPAQGSESYNGTGYSKNDFDFRLLNYLGMRNDSSNYPYPYATSDGRERDLTESPGAVSCWLGGSNGLINRFVKEWLLYFLRTEEVEITAHLPPDLLLQLQPVKKLRFTTRSRALIPAMISQVSFEQGTGRNADKLSAKIKIYPVYNQSASDVQEYTEIGQGEVINAGSIYVRYRQVETSREYYKGSAQVSSIKVNAFLDFYSDPACTVARNVTNFPVYMLYNYRGENERNYIIDQRYEVRANGSSYQIPDIQEIFYFNGGGDYWSKEYKLDPAGGPDYTIK
ncbi:hypothetical protein [Mucilaginibacter sp. CSA2-8R]|uniref:hypothetical protein n=1 Tax=Mucilaginibacter sp. CSA2-8R TaxID=3141542 RepID=UPI00315D9C30